MLKMFLFRPQTVPSRSARPRRPQPKMRSGIGGIEKQMEQKSRYAEKEISKAFQDLDKLMEMAKPMVMLANNISKKMKVSANK